MTSSFQKIGDYISIIDNRNSDGSITRLMGISIDKCYIPSVANVIGTDLNTYKVIRKGQFACSLMQVSRDQRIPIAMYEYDAPAIMSPAYVMFEVSRSDELLSEYMELWFKRAEFDREASFYAVGGVRGSLDWEDFCKMKLPVPSIDKQRKIVHDYQVITNRIMLLKRIVNVLKEQISYVFKEMFENDESENWEKKCLGEYLTLERGLSYKGEYLSDEGVPMINLGNILPNSTYRAEKIKYYTGDYAERHIVHEGDILVANTDLTSAREVIGSAIRVPLLKSQPVICSHHISIVRNCRISKYYILGLFNRPTFRERVKGFATGTTVYAIPTETILNFEVNIPPESVVADYEKTVAPLYAYADSIQAEVWSLDVLKERLLGRIPYAG